jgi:hypothetical protein
VEPLARVSGVNQEQPTVRGKSEEVEVERELRVGVVQQLAGRYVPDSHHGGVGSAREQLTVRRENEVGDPPPVEFGEFEELFLRFQVPNLHDARAQLIHGRRQNHLQGREPFAVG